MVKKSQPVSIIISTKNRRECLRVALRSIQKQTVAHEIIVLDDGSTDNTAEMVAAEFPEVRLIRSEESLGVIPQRNLGAEMARYPVIVSFDDDVELLDPHTIEQTLKYLDHPRVGAVTIPFINVNRDKKIMKQAPEREGIYVTGTFIGAGYIVHRDLFLRLRGYRESIYMETEESDYCLRMLDAGYVVRLGWAEPFNHYHSPVRDSARRALLSYSNLVLFYWHNMPMPVLPFSLLKLTVRMIFIGLLKRQPGVALGGLFNGFRAIHTEFSERRPLNLTTWRIFRGIGRRKYATLEDIEHLLPPLPAAGKKAGHPHRSL